MEKHVIAMYLPLAMILHLATWLAIEKAETTSYQSWSLQAFLVSTEEGKHSTLGKHISLLTLFLCHNFLS